jgi:putative transposase
MPRGNRSTVSQECGASHINSHLVDENALFSNDEKEYFLRLMERLSSGFFIRIHAFAVMSNHFHILVTEMGLEAKQASKEELLNRYKLIYAKQSEPPPGRYESNGNIIPDVDGGIQRLRTRFGSVSRFVQELKQGFSRWYNKKHNRKGYLWNGRFTGVIVFHGLAELICSAYIDLNPIRAGMVELPEDYRWSSFGMRLRSPKRAEKLLWPITLADALERSENIYGLPFLRVTKELVGIEWYRQFVYESGGIKRKDKASIPQSIVDQVVACNGHLGITGRLRYRIKNFSEGIAIGGYTAIAELQASGNRKYIRPRAFLDTYWAYTTRVLKL